MSDAAPIPGLDGAQRQNVAAGLWSAWREAKRGAALLTGFSGLGKTEQVVRPLVARAKAMRIPAVVIEVPLHPTDVDQELLSRLVEELRDGGDTALGETIEKEASFAAGLRRLLREGALVVVDEFQRLLVVASGEPAEPFNDKLRKVAQRTGDEGCLWLVSNREVDSAWTEPFHTAHLEVPKELADQQKIVLDAIAASDADERFPTHRRLEVIRRLGANPRVLRLLGNLLRHYSLEELLGPPGEVPEAPAEPRLTEGIERGLLVKAEEGLSKSALSLLRDLTVLRDAAPWGLIEAIGASLGDVRALARELRDRFLLENRSNRYHLHPAVREVDGPRLHQDVKAWNDAHRRAGLWYAQPLFSASERASGDAELALRLAGARYHLLEAGAVDDLRAAMRGLRSFVERKYGLTPRRPANSAERDGQIALLDLYLEEPGSAGVEYTFAKLLKQRGSPGDLEKALPHAQRATAGQDHNQPWILWVQLVREVEGLEAAIAAGKTATTHVAASKGASTVYQLLGACLNHLGQDEKAIEVLLDGAKGAFGHEDYLVSEALLFAAAQPSSAPLQQVHAWAVSHAPLAASVAFADVLLLEHQGNWRAGAEAAQRGRELVPTYLFLALHEAICWIAVGEPENANRALDEFPNPMHLRVGSAAAWLRSLISLHRGDLPSAAAFLASYTGINGPTTGKGIGAALLREWDHRVGIMGGANPAFEFPILPPTVTGLDGDVQRRNYGPPVLPQHQSLPALTVTRQNMGLRVLALATEWDSGAGGLSTLNRQLCRALAAAGVRVVCLVLDQDSGLIRQVDGVTLIGATRTPGRPESEALSRRPTLPEGFTPDVIIGHGRVTGPAAQILAEDDFQSAKLLHFVHMAPDEIEWLKLDRDGDVGLRAEERTQVELDLGRRATRVVAVGPRLHNRYLRDLSAYDVPAPLRFDPGFDAFAPLERTPPPGEPWSVLLLGRAEDDHLKGLDLAARAVGLALERRGGMTPIELVVRGAQPGTSEDLREKLRTWSGLPALSVIVRPYSTDTERLDADLRRASLVLMPSRTEGFGLVGLEAIVAGTPVLVTAESGLGALLRETLENEQASRLVIPMSGDDDEDRDTWGRAVEATLRDREAAFRRAAEVRGQLARQKTWAAAVAGLLAELKELLRDEGRPS
jgi:glycosyltransferase involved in cell wall biosynthesis